ncbi:MAG TPA: hypothetical protein GX528_03105 [Firmicutes bacterium]|nr:hypothetical protein [Bacillota bacterium]
MDRSTKEKVIAQARQDPFLTVEEIAKMAETTERYVRTILSEADLSLTQMRKTYARSLERRLGRLVPKQDLPVQKELKISQLRSARLAGKLNLPQGQELFEISHLTTKKGVLSYVQLVTAEQVVLAPQRNCLRELLPYPAGEVYAGEQKAETVAAGPGLAEILDLLPDQRVLKISTLLHRGKEPIALEFRWLPWEGIVLRWSAQSREVEVLQTG